jgi:hypothetical protein
MLHRRPLGETAGCDLTVPVGGGDGNGDDGDDGDGDDSDDGGGDGGDDGHDFGGDCDGDNAGGGWHDDMLFACAPYVDAIKVREGADVAV